MKSKFLLLSKISLVLVCIGFFMPVSCNLSFADMVSISVKGSFSFWVIPVTLIFVAAIFSILISIWHKNNFKNESLVLDWILLVLSTSSGCTFFLYNRYGLQYGAYVIISGWILSLIFLLLATIFKNK
ncbi:hypothetical protein [uncultured Treponema sp.]|uniref:hypothetical protein n=1 Tax=uncultured Treponema sp. TaxID=162155 RepID=UPI00260C051E|nr:hypothetical protein [uncultured Treponema sp.]